MGEKDEKQAIHFYKLAAKKQFVPSLISLSFSYRLGLGVHINPELSFINMEIAAELDNSYAQNCLAFFYEEGYGTTIDFEKSLYWYKKSADKGNPWAQCNLG